MECRAHSRHLQRIMTDFGADESFGQASVKVREHDGIEIPVKSLGNVRLAHARQFAGQEQESLDEQCPALEEGVKRVILQSDGAMVPVVGIRAGRGDARKRREAGWKEAKSTLAYEPRTGHPCLCGHDEAQGSGGLADAASRPRRGHGAANKSSRTRRRSSLD